jgi:hypothetical protein
MKTSLRCSLLAFVLTFVAWVPRAHAADSAAVAAKVAALPDVGAAGQVKAMLTVALERVKACTDANDEADATALLGDIEAALAKDPATLTIASTNTQTISLLRAPKVVDGNPYLQRLFDGAKAALATPEQPWAKNTPEVNTFNGLSGGAGSRSTGEEMEAWLWLYANAASPMKGAPRALERYLRLAHAYADALDVHGTAQMQAEVAEIKDSGPKAGQGIFDDFAIAPAADALREFAQLYPGLLLPSQKAQWDRAMANGGRIMWGKAKDRQGDYANIDITLGFELESFGLYLNNQEYLDKAKFLVEVQDKNIYPDGAIAYIGHQNESCTYHDADVHYLMRYYEITGDEKVADLVRKTEWYGPVSDNKLCEFWTTPSWKDTWNSDRVFAGGEEAAGLTGNPYLRALCDAVLAQPDNGKGWAHDYAPLPWFRNDVKPLPLPDNYTVIDRNIAGPRAWYGRFNYACTTRSAPDTESGLRTMMGAQMIQPDGHLGQIAMDIFPRIREKTDSGEAEGKFERAAFASRMTDLTSAVVMGRSFSGVAARFTLQQYRSSSPGNKVDWGGRQTWLGLPDRIVGLVEVNALKDGAKAIDVEGVVRLGTGGTVNGPPTEIKELGNNSWQYGDLIVTVLAHNYAAIQTPVVPFRVPKFPNTEVRLVDDKGAGGATTPSAYGADTHYYYLVEIRPSTTADAAQATLLTPAPGVQGFAVTAGARHFLLAANLTGGDLKYTPPDGFSGANVSVHSSLGGVGKAGAGTLKAGELQVVVNSPDPDDQLPGWANFADMLTALGKK